MQIKTFSKCVLALILAPLAFSQTINDQDEISRRYHIYTFFWRGSIAAGVAHTVGIPSTLNTDKPVYVGSVTVVSEVETTLHIRKGVATDPATVAAVFGSTVSPSVTGNNTNSTPIFKFWPVSGVADSSLMTSYKLLANDPKGIGLVGALLNTGKSTARNFNFHFDAGAGIAQITGLIYQRK